MEMAEKRPDSLDAMAGISGIGAKKLEKYGKAFLDVIVGETAEVHPMRRKLAGRTEGALYDRLLAVQADLNRGEDGAGKPMSCSASVLAKVAQLRGANLDSLKRLIGDRHAERFGDAFLAVLEDG